MKANLILSAFGFAGLLGGFFNPDLPDNMHRWLLEMHAAQIELLKIDWGQPGFCTEWDRDYNPRTRSCRRRAKLVERHYVR